MAQPALKLNEYGARLTDFSRELPELELRRMLLELERATKTLSGPDLANTYSLMGMALDRLGKPERALPEFKKSARIQPNHRHKLNLAKSYLRLGHLEDAVDVLAEVVDLDGRDVPALTCFAEALFRLGSLQDAREIFEQAISVADFTNPNEILTLAAHAAKVGIDAEAVELYARFLSVLSGVALADRPAVTFIEQVLASSKGDALAYVPELKRAVERAMLFGPGVEHLRMMPLPAEPPIVSPADADETPEDVLAWLGPHRARANAAVLQEGDEDE